MELRKANVGDEIAVRDGRFEIVKIDGDSMTPALRDGDLVVIDPAESEFAVGDIVFARHPFKQSIRVIKRIAEILDGPRYVLHGDNPSSSTDSRTLGPFSNSEILGKAVARVTNE